MIKGKHKYFWYASLALVVIVTALISSQAIEKKEQEQGEPKAKKELPPIQLEIEEALEITAGIKAKKSTQISSGVIITEKGDELLVLINKNIRLPETYEPSDLVTIDGKVSTTKPGMMLRKEAADAMANMTTTAIKDEMNLVVLSAYRSYWTQQATFSMWVGAAGLESAQNFSARPGHSQHQLGTTIDFTSESVNLGLTDSFDASKEGLWLVNNAHKFGFALSYPKGKEDITGYMYEPWHYRYIGVGNVQKMIDSGLILEEFLQDFGVI